MAKIGSSNRPSPYSGAKTRLSISFFKRDAALRAFSGVRAGYFGSCLHPFAYTNQEFQAATCRNGGTLWLSHCQGGTSVPSRDGRGVNGLVNGPRIMRRAHELGLGSVLLFAAAVLSCHAQAASDCALPQGFHSRASADPFTAWDSAGTWYAQRKDLHCASVAYGKALQLRPQSWRT